MTEKTQTLVKNLPFHEMQVLEISGNAWRDFGFKSYTSVQFPQFDICEQTLSERFDLIISDIRMPEMNGVETIKKIREISMAAGNPLIPEILMSGFADPQLTEQAEKLGVANFFYKPFDLSQFIAAVKKILAN